MQKKESFYFLQGDTGYQVISSLYTLHRPQSKLCYKTLHNLGIRRDVFVTLKEIELLEGVLGTLKTFFCNFCVRFGFSFRQPLPPPPPTFDLKP